MSFELKTDEELKEYILETITKPVEQTVKHWTKEQLSEEITKLLAEITEQQERIAVLEEQLARFK